MAKQTEKIELGLRELRAARKEHRHLFWAVGLFSAFANLLMMTGPLYMLQVYDRVLSSRSVETLVALTALVAFLYAIMGILDFTRGRILARIGARFQNKLERRVFDANFSQRSTQPKSGTPTGLTDLDALYRFFASPAPTVGFDLPWTPIFLIGIAIFHPWLGYLAMVGGTIMVVLTWLNQLLSASSLSQAHDSMRQVMRIGDQFAEKSEVIHALGAQSSAFRHWKNWRNQARNLQVVANDAGGGFASLIKTFRLFLQSAMLGLGAYLVLQGELSPGAMIAGSILMGRALAPIELAIGHWQIIQSARSGWTNLATLLASAPEPKTGTKLPEPKARLEVQDLTVLPPGQTRAALRLVNFVVEPGQALGVIGPSDSGKSTLARAIIGIWASAAGKVCLDGAEVNQYSPEDLGSYVGFLSQQIQVFDGTVTENIARLSQKPDREKVIKAAKRAGAHDMILSLPDGYDSRLSTYNCAVSEGHLRLIGLARTLYSNPVILLLDEPYAGLDHAGTEALNAVIRQQKCDGNSVILMSNRPAALQDCDLLLVLKDGGVSQFGPRDEVLRKTVTNFQDVQFLHGSGNANARQ